MKSINEQTIKRLQKLAGINEIKIMNPGNYLPKDIKEFLDKKLSTENDLNYLLLGWLEGTSEEPEEGYITNEDKWENILGNYKDWYDDEDLDPETIEFLERAKGIDNTIYLNNIHDWGYPEEYSTQEGYNDIKIEFKGDFYKILVPNMNEMGKYIGYFDGEGNYHFFD